MYASQYPVPPVPLRVAWYHQPLFVTLALLVFFPGGIVLLWMSPRTQLVGRLLWTILWGPAWSVLALFAMFQPWNSPRVAPRYEQPIRVVVAPKAEPVPSASPVPKPAVPAPAVEPVAPVDLDYNWSVTDPDSGKVYKGRVPSAASGVGVAVIDVQVVDVVGGTYINRKASPGTVYVVARVYVQNLRRDPVTMDQSLFKLMYAGQEFEADAQASLLLSAAKKEPFLLRSVNPGMLAEGYVAFEVPNAFKPDAGRLMFRGGMGGMLASIPLLPAVQP